MQHGNKLRAIKRPSRSAAAAALSLSLSLNYDELAYLPRRLLGAPEQSENRIFKQIQVRNRRRLRAPEWAAKRARVSIGAGGRNETSAS